MSATRVALVDNAEHDFAVQIAGRAVEASPTIVPVGQSRSPGDDQLKVLARALGRQAARRHLAGGRSILEIAIFVAIGALAVGAALYSGLVHFGSR